MRVREDFQARSSRLCRKGHFGIADARVCRHQQCTGARLAAAWNNMIAALHCTIERYAASIALRVFDHRHGVRSGRNARARHDFDALSCLQCAFKAAAGAQFADANDTGTRHNRIRGSHRKTIARGAVERRIVAISTRPNDCSISMVSRRGGRRRAPATSITFRRASA